MTWLLLVLAIAVVAVYLLRQIQQPSDTPTLDKVRSRRAHKPKKVNPW